MTPRPAFRARIDLERRIASIYEQVRPGEAAERAMVVCRDLRDGSPPERLKGDVRAAFSDEARGVPTPQQAERLLGAIRDSAIC